MHSRETKYRYREGQRLCPDVKRPRSLRKGNTGRLACFKRRAGAARSFSSATGHRKPAVGRVPTRRSTIRLIHSKESRNAAVIAATLLAVKTQSFSSRISKMITPGRVQPAASSLMRASRSAGEGSSRRHQISESAKGGASKQLIVLGRDLSVSVCWEGNEDDSLSGRKKMGVIASED